MPYPKVPKGARVVERARPAPARNPKLYAALHGIAESTLSEWRHHSEVIAVVKEWREPYRQQFSSIVEAMSVEARRGNVSAARLIGEWLGENKPQPGLSLTLSDDFASLAPQAGTGGTPAPLALSAPAERSN